MTPAAATATTPTVSPARIMEVGMAFWPAKVLLSAIELQVFKDGQLVGSSSEALTLPRGSHQLEFVNETLFGVEAVSKSISMVNHYAHEQEIIPRRYGTDDLFDTSMKALRA